MKKLIKSWWIVFVILVFMVIITVIVIGFKNTKFI
jgi:heme/copper-type cytochrome/quinol oxidase subunit 2